MAAGAARRGVERLGGAEFRAFQAGRPDHERWELVGGRPVMMTPPTLAHNRIADNLARLLDDALAANAPARLAVQRAGIELGVEADDFRPEPDVAVIDADFAPGQRFAARAYLVAEITSASDAAPVPGEAMPWIDVKRRLYRAHPPCTAILVVDQDRLEVLVERRGADGWRAERLAGPEARLDLPEFGLGCRLAALYAGTPLAR